MATSVSEFTTPDTEELLPDMDGTCKAMSLRPPLIGAQWRQIANPGSVTPTLFYPLAGDPATQGLPGPSRSYSPTQYNQTVNVTVDARSLTMEVTEIRQEVERSTS